MEADRPWTLVERFDRAKQMAREGRSIEEIEAECSLEPDTVKCIRQRERPDYSSPNAFASLRKNMKDD